MQSDLATNNKQKNNFEKVLEILKTIASKPSGFIGLSILIFHILLALMSHILHLMITKR